jgi:ribosomal protein S18 acetylase RimI-like enzyme
MAELQIRPAVATDEAAVVDCVATAYDKYIARIGKKPAPLLDDYALMIKEGQVFCGEYGGQIVGILVLRQDDDYLLLNNVAIYPRFQGRGWGKQLIGFAEEMARQHGYREIRLYTNSKMFENIEIYPKLGYIEYEKKYENGYHRVYFHKFL